MNFRNDFKTKSQETAVGVRSAGTIILVVDVVSFGIGLTENQNALQRWKCVRFVRKLAVQCRNVILFPKHRNVGIVSMSTPLRHYKRFHVPLS